MMTWLERFERKLEIVYAGGGAGGGKKERKRVI